MGHAKSMSETYTHLEKDDVKNMLKSQVYKTEELTPKEKSEVKKLKEEIEEMKNNFISKEDAGNVLREMFSEILKSKQLKPMIKVRYQ